MLKPVIHMNCVSDRKIICFVPSLIVSVRCTVYVFIAAANICTLFFAGYETFCILQKYGNDFNFILPLRMQCSAHTTFCVGDCFAPLSTYCTVQIQLMVVFLNNHNEAREKVIFPVVLI